MKLVFMALLLALLSLFAEAGKVNGRLIVKTKVGFVLPELKNSIHSQHLFENNYVVYTKSIRKLKSELKTNENIDSFEKDFITKQDIFSPSVTDQLEFKPKKNRTFNDPLVYSKWSILNSHAYGVSVFRTHKENLSRPISKTIVAVLDTGVDFNHEDLPIWKNVGEIPDNGIDDDFNGYIDDVHGINTTHRKRSVFASSNVMDDHDHGTHLAGVIGAKFQNYVGVVGIASNVEIMGVKIISKSSKVSDVDFIEGLIYAAKNGAKIITATFLKDPKKSSKAVYEAIKFVTKKYDVLFVTGAGNNSRNLEYFPSAPATFKSSNVLTVASTDKYGGLSFFSNYSPIFVDIAAPGSSVYSTIRNNKYFYMSGTSVASAIVSGVAAEILSNNPGLTGEELKEILLESVSPVDSFEGRVKSQGIVDLYRALKAAP